MAVTFLTNEDENKYVKSINGNKPDGFGNVVIDVQPGATLEQVAQIQDNTENIEAIGEVLEILMNAESEHFCVNFTKNSDGSYSADKTRQETVNAHLSGKIVNCLVPVGIERVNLSLKSEAFGILKFEGVYNGKNVRVKYSYDDAVTPMIDDIITVEVVAFSTDNEHIVGTTYEITPTQVVEAISAGRDITVAYADKTFGLFWFTAFDVNASLEVVFASSILRYNGVYGVVELIGDYSTDEWNFIVQQIPITSDIPTDEHINSLIDDKLDSSGENVDWNQNNPEAADYIINRPFYTEDPVKTVVFEEETVVVGSDLYAQCVQLMYIDVGRTYYVTFNGTEYECVAWKDKSYDNVPCIGNGTFVAVEGQGNGEPFLIEGLYGSTEPTEGDPGCFLDSEQGEHTVSVSTMIETVHQLDIKYVPSDDRKMNVESPVCAGEFSMNRLSDSAIGNYSSTLGAFCKATGDYSHAEGLNTIATGQCSHVQGIYNIEDSENKYLHIVGNGSRKYGQRVNSNAHTLDWEGNAWYAGDVYVGSTSGTNRDEGSKKLATEEYVQESYQPKGEYLTQHQDISGKLDAEKLPESVNAALAQAKASGEFDGAPGYTPVKGTDYYTEADKTEMVNAVIAALPTWTGGSY